MLNALLFQTPSTLKKTMRDYIDRPTPVRDAKARKNMEELRKERERLGLSLDRPLVW